MLSAGRLFKRADKSRVRNFAVIVLSIPCTFNLSEAVAFGQTASQGADAIITRAMKDRMIPGLQVAVAQHGKVVFSGSYGVANLQTPVAVNSDTLFSINSITKAFVGIAVMQEVERGRLDLSLPISTYLTDIPASWGEVTVRQLLGQASGLPDIWDYGNSDDTGIIDEKAAWAWALSRPVSAPGVKENYCQTNLRLVQLILNKLNARDPDASVIDEELTKAGMVSTSYGDSRDVIKNKSQPYRVGDTGVLWNHFERFGPMMHANSGLNTTADDMARWMISILDGKQISEHARQIMWTAVALKNGSLSSFGIGWDSQHRANYDSFGMFGGARSAFALYPKYDLGVVILTNLVGAAPEELTDEVAASFEPRLELSGVLALRARAELSEFKDFDSLIKSARSQDSRQFSNREFEAWVVRLLDDGKPGRAVQVSKLYLALFPNVDNALEMLGRSYKANAQSDEAHRIFVQLLARDPRNRFALRDLEKTK